MWRCPYCSSISPRHWNVERHIKLQHGLSGEPIDSITGLIRGKSFRKPMQFRPWAAPSSSNNRSKNNSDNKFWEMADKIRITRELELLREIKGNLLAIRQQNTQIILLLGSIVNARRF
jgi:hypothetical protein